MIFNNLINFILKLLVLFLRIIIFSISRIIIIKFVLFETSRLGGISRTIDDFLYHPIDKKNYVKYIFIYFRELPISNYFFQNLVEKEIKKINKNTYFFDNSKFSKYLFSSFSRFPFGKESFHRPYNELKGRNNLFFNYDYVKNPQLRLNSKESTKGYELLEELKIKNKKKWICIHNRDSNYLKILTNHENFKNINFAYHNYRDSDVNNLIKSTKLLLEKNFTVFRMGRIQSNKMNFKQEDFIDYAFEDKKSDFNDIFLLTNCEAYLGSDAGISDIPFISGKPRFLTNYSLTLMHLFHHGGHYLSRKNHYPFIFKHLYDEKNKIKLSLRQILKKGLNAAVRAEDFKNAGVIPIENSEDELLDLTLEMANYLDTKNFNTKDDYEIQKKFWDIYYSNTNYKRYEDIPARVCSNFLLKNSYILE